jgi:chromosomal replication initiator protein
MFVIGVENSYAKDWLDSRLHSTVQRTLSGITGQAASVRFVVQTTPVVMPAAAEPAPLQPAGDPSANAGLSQLRLHPKYTFDTFVVGPSNRLAHAAANAAAETPARSYNPLFLYGGVGLGKTHLLQAIGNACAARGLAVLYASAEQFTNDLISAIRTHTTEAFRGKYRSIEVLLIDDIQFIAGKEATQEEFFHTFNALHGQNKQIVLSSDRSPKTLATLEERLRSRFEWGLIADVQPPDYETRTAILNSKADALCRRVPPEVIDLIARRVQSNIRELEGAFNRVVATGDVLGQPLTLESTAQAIADLLPRPRSLGPSHILETVANFYAVKVDDIVGRDRSKEITTPRQVAMYLVREETDASLPEIGQLLDGRDHTTVMHGCAKISNLIETDDAFRRQVLAIRERLYADIAPLS